MGRIQAYGGAESTSPSAAEAKVLDLKPEEWSEITDFIANGGYLLSEADDSVCDGDHCAVAHDVTTR